MFVIVIIIQAIVSFLFMMFLCENGMDIDFKSINKIKLVIFLIIGGPILWFILFIMQFAKFICSKKGQEFVEIFNTWLKK